MLVLDKKQIEEVIDLNGMMDQIEAVSYTHLYLPDEIKNARFYEASENGHEKEIQAWMKYLRE